jgi:hypothetical protein
MWETGRHVPRRVLPATGGWPATPGNSKLTNTMKLKPKTQCQRLLAYLKKNRKGITTMEAFEHLRITCVHKRIAEIDGRPIVASDGRCVGWNNITRTKERTASGSIVTRYKLAR